jgi:hypothetical protein
MVLRRTGEWRREEGGIVDNSLHVVDVKESWRLARRPV